MKGLYVNVMVDADGTDCTAGGVTSKTSRILLVDALIEGIYEPKEDEIYLVLIRRVIYHGEKPYIHAEPRKNGKPLHIGGMAGGNFVYSCDSRFSNINHYPISVHDRFEF